MENEEEENVYLLRSQRITPSGQIAGNGKKRD